jgi:glutathione S-transferase
MVLIFAILFLALLGVAWRRIASSLRVAAIRTVQAQRDQGSTVALARAMHLLETGTPPSSPSPYVCGTTITIANAPHAYTVTFTAEGDTGWAVHVDVTQSGDTPPAMPGTFATIPPPP